jgi:chaperonin cofactor prefoldin
MSDLTLGERVATVETKIETLDRDVKSVTEKLDRLQFWIMATFGGVATGVLLMLLQLAVKK